MPGDLTTEIRIAYQSQPVGVTEIETLEWNHPAFESPVYIACGIEDDIMLPLTHGGEPVLFKAVSVQILLPNHTAEGFTPFRIVADNVGNFLRPHIKAASVGSYPITLTYRSYVTSDLTKPGEVIPGLEMRGVSLNAIAASGTLSFKEIELHAYPLATYDEEFYPAAQGNG